MTAINKAASQFVSAQLLPPKSDTGTTGTGIEVTDYEGLGNVIVSVGAATGSGVLKVLIEDSADNSSWAAVTAFGTLGTGYTANTNASGNVIYTYPINLEATRRYVRATSSVVSGTSAVLSVMLTAIKKVSG